MELSQQVSVQHELHLTTELRQGILVLQMSAVDLAEYVRQNVEENPFLDDDDWEWPRHPQSVGEYSKTVSADALSSSRTELSARQVSLAGSQEDDAPFDRYFATQETLADHLLFQLRLQVCSERMRAACETVVGCLDANGYLRETKDEIAVLANVSSDEAASAIELVRGMDPLGVASSSLADCLRVQLEAKGLLSSAAERFLSEHLETFGTKNPQQIARTMGVAPAVLDEVLRDIRTCNPYPAAQFGRACDAVWPEVLVEGPDETGSYTVRLQDFFLPHLRVNNYYKTLASDQKASASKKYLTEKLGQAESLIDNIEYRKATLYKVSCCIVELQRDFFSEGASALRPLTMEDVALATELSLSTVSRIVNGNYLQAPGGLYELRYFFQAAASSSLCCDASRESVKCRLAELVAAENPCKPLSDQALADLLHSEGLDVSRRTVNKYRNELGIPPKSFRKRAS